MQKTFSVNYLAGEVVRLNSSLAPALSLDKFLKEVLFQNGEDIIDIDSSVLNEKLDSYSISFRGKNANAF